MFTSLHTRFGFDADAVADVADPETDGQKTTVPALERLAGLGLLKQGVGSQEGLETQAAVISALAQRSLSIAFSVWAHRMVIEYVAASEPDSDKQALLEDADLIGSTAMASALRASLGLERVGLTATSAEDGYRITGTIPWASNLHVGRTLVVAAAERQDLTHVVVAFDLDGSGAYPSSTPELLALQATSSGPVTVDKVNVDRRNILSEDLDSFLTRVRPTFMLLQAAFAIGFGESALAALDGVLVGADEVLVEDRDRLLAQHDRLVALTAMAADGILASRDLLAYRLVAAEFAQAAVAAETRRTGGRGYVATSDTARRIREAAFLPIQSPTESQLKWELACST